MKRCLFIGLLAFGAAAFAQNDLDAMLATGGVPSSADGARQRLDACVSRLAGSGAHDQRLLRKTFNRLHSNFLRKYEAYSPVGAAFSSGKYDCLTGTALFALVLDQLHYSYDIIETNYHIFILVRTSGGEVLLETTDQLRGFISDAGEIARRTGDYRKNKCTSDDSKNVYHYSFDLYQKISPDRLTGLLYFNQAVKAYNERNWVGSAKLLEKANALYASPRCEALGAILIRTVLESPLEEHAKTECLAHLRNFWMKKSDRVASN